MFKCTASQKYKKNRNWTRFQAHPQLGSYLDNRYNTILKLTRRIGCPFSFSLLNFSVSYFLLHFLTRFSCLSFLFANTCMLHHSRFFTHIFQHFLRKTCKYFPAIISLFSLPETDLFYQMFM